MPEAFLIFIYLCIAASWGVIALEIIEFIEAIE